VRRWSFNPDKCSIGFHVTNDDDNDDDCNTMRMTLSAPSDFTTVAEFIIRKTETPTDPFEEPMLKFVTPGRKFVYILGMNRGTPFIAMQFCLAKRKGCVDMPVSEYVQRLAFTAEVKGRSPFYGGEDLVARSQTSVVFEHVSTTKPHPAAAPSSSPPVLVPHGLPDPRQTELHKRYQQQFNTRRMINQTTQDDDDETTRIATTATDDEPAAKKTRSKRRAVTMHFIG
jgi:hypothetical protein